MVLDDVDRARLTGKVALASGGLQDLLRRLQSGIRIRNGTAELTIDEQDAAKVARYWVKTGGRPGSGGYQRMLPIKSLRAYLPTVAPLFMDTAPEAKPGVSYVYFKQEVGQANSPIKIGRGTDKRASSGFSTDNHTKLVVLLRMAEEPGRDEAYFHQRFDRWRKSKQQEWFWPSDELLEFIRAESAEQKLQEQRRGDDAASAR